MKANGWQSKKYVRKADRIRELLLEGLNCREIQAQLKDERGCETYKSEVSSARRPLVRRGEPGLDKRCRVVVEGVEYPSISAAAQAHRISRQAAHKRLASNNWQEWKRIT